MASQGQPLLQVDDLRTYLYTRRGIVRAVNGVSFSVDQGETLGLVGESGCGKSMTCLSILRLLPPRTGRIVGGRVLFSGEDLLAKSEADMGSIRGRLISMILQDPMTSLNPVFQIGEQLAEPLKTHQRLRGATLWAKVVDMLRLMRIPAPEVRVHEYPHQMSGGMRQRIVGAMALSCQPRLLIADEPTTSLDVTIQAQFLSLLREVTRELGLAAIIVTHDLGIVARVCDRIAVMYAGKIVEAGTTREIFRNPSHAYTRSLLDSLPRLETKMERLRCIDGQPPDLANLPQGCSFAARCPQRSEQCHASEPSEVVVAGGHTIRCWNWN